MTSDTGFVRRLLACCLGMALLAACGASSRHDDDGRTAADGSIDGSISSGDLGVDNAPSIGEGEGGGLTSDGGGVDGSLRDTETTDEVASLDDDVTEDIEAADAGDDDALVDADGGDTADINGDVDSLDSKVDIDAIDGMSRADDARGDPDVATDAQPSPDVVEVFDLAEVEDGPEVTVNCGACGPDWIPQCSDTEPGWLMCSDILPAGADVAEDPCWHYEVIDCGVGAVCVDADGPACVCPPNGETMCGNHAYGGQILVESTCGYGGLLATKVFPDGYPPVGSCEMPGCADGARIENQHSTILWPLPSMSGLYAIEPSGPGNLLVGGVNGAIFHLEAGVWKDYRWLDEIAKIVALHAEPDGFWLAVSEGPIINRSKSGSWLVSDVSDAILHPPGGKDGGYATRGALIFGPDDFWLAKQNGWLAYVDAGTVTWIDTGFEDAVQSDLLDVWGPHTGDVWAVGQKGRVLHVIDGEAEAIPGLEISKSGESVDIHDVHGDGNGVIVVVQGPKLWQRDGDAWTLMFETSEPSAEHDVWVHGPEDIWVAGDTLFHHFDGETWTSEAQSIAPANRILGFACASPEECWATGLFGLVLHWTPGTNWKLASTGQDADLGPPGHLPTQAIFAPDDENIFTAVITGHGETPKSERVAFARRFHVLSTPGTAPVVTNVETWDLGSAPFAGENVGLRGLWGTSKDNVFLGTDTPLHFDGDTWAPLDLPADVLATHWVPSLRGRDGQLYVLLEHQTQPDLTLVAHRPAEGGSWEFLPTGSGFVPGAFVVDMAIGPDGKIFVLSGAGGVLSSFDPVTDEWSFMSFVENPFFDCRIEVSHAGELLIMGGFHAQAFQFADGEMISNAVFFDPGQTTGIVLPPLGPGFVATTLVTILDMFRPDLPGDPPIDVPQADKYGPPVLFQETKPWVYTGNVHTALAVAPAGGLYVGTVGAGLVHVPAPWEID